MKARHISYFFIILVILILLYLAFKPNGWFNISYTDRNGNGSNNSLSRQATSSGPIVVKTDCVKHTYEDTFKKVSYEIIITAVNCRNPLVPDAIKFVSDFMNVHIKQGIVNTPQQIIAELTAQFNAKYPNSIGLKTSIK